jgi:hypothetical protein
MQTLKTIEQKGNQANNCYSFSCIGLAGDNLVRMRFLEKKGGFALFGGVDGATDLMMDELQNRNVPRRR